MIDQDRLRVILLHAFAIYLAMSFVQLQAKQHSWRAPQGWTMAGVVDLVRAQAAAVAQAQENGAMPFAFGD